MPSEDYKPRFTFDISEEQKDRADRLISQYGVRKSIFQPILDDVLDMVETHGGLAIGILLSGHVKPREIIPTLKKADDLIGGIPNGKP